MASGARSEAEIVSVWEQREAEAGQGGKEVRPEKKKTHKVSREEVSEEQKGQGEDPMLLSERRLDEWRRAAAAPPRVFPLARATSLCLSDGLGVSTHTDRFVRMWEASGRRLGAFSHKAELSASDAAEGFVAVGDVAGGLLLFGNEELTPLKASAPERVVSLALLPEQPAPLLLVSCANGSVCAFTTAPLRLTQPALPLALGRGEHALAPGPSGGVFASAGGRIGLFDLSGAAAVWRAEEAWQGEPEWSADAPCAAPTQPSRPLSYSPFWRLLAVNGPEGVGLWDVRVAGSRGAAAVVGCASAWVHLDEAHGMAGHLLLAPSEGGRISLFDVRRLSAARHASAAIEVASFDCPPGEGCCFGAHGTTLVVGGASCEEAWCYGGEAPAEDEEEKPRTTHQTRSKPKRQVSSTGRRMFNRTK
ncbi:MAG: hypothetical protein SGPRY_004335 [Prymnesium sp.]